MGILPCALVAVWEAQARREFALGLPPGALPPVERTRWVRVNIPSTWLLLLLLFAFSLTVWRLAMLALHAHVFPSST